MIDEHDLREMLRRRANTVPTNTVDVPKASRRARRRLLANGAVAVLATAAIAVATFAGIDAVRTAPIPGGHPDTPVEEPPPPDSPRPTPSVWSPVLERGDSVVLPAHGRTWTDPLDAAEGWVDVKSVHFSTLGYTGWTIELAAKPPLPADREPGLLIAYGLVLDTTGDGVADYVIGIVNDAPKRRDFRVWVTDLATGETDEQVGPPYGFPIEFSHPDESRRDQVRTMHFTFLPGSAPADLDPKTVRFYAWASAASDGEVLARDYAPDTGWMTKR